MTAPRTEHSTQCGHAQAAGQNSFDFGHDRRNLLPCKHLAAQLAKATVIAQNGTPITWQTVGHDTLVAIAGVGQVLETTQSIGWNATYDARNLKLTEALPGHNPDGWRCRFNSVLPVPVSCRLGALGTPPRIRPPSMTFT